jgi:hypothetical protein
MITVSLAVVALPSSAAVPVIIRPSPAGPVHSTTDAPLTQVPFNLQSEICDLRSS